MAVTKLDLTPRGNIFAGNKQHTPGETFEIRGERLLGNLGSLNEKLYVACAEWHDGNADPTVFYVSDGQQWNKVEQDEYEKAIKDYQASWKKQLKVIAKQEAEAKQADADRAAQKAAEVQAEADKHNEPEATEQPSQPA